MYIYGDPQSIHVFSHFGVILRVHFVYIYGDP